MTTLLAYLKMARERLSGTLELGEQEFRQIFPGGVLGFDQSESFSPIPVLDLLFARNSGTDVPEFLVIYEPMNSVALRESRDRPCLCWEILRSKLLVTPVYKFRDRLATMYTK
jgi:hypothetical protein